MKEVTRIHLAKTAYDIEVLAKKQLEKYIKNLEIYTQDADVLSDIEIRMTEILAERSVPAGGVISTEDIEAIRAQLGEPHEFADEGDIAVGSDGASSAKSSIENRRYYRDLDGAVLGGVLSGVSTYFGFNPLWARLVFIIALIMSWGAAILVYIVLWIAVPPARTAAERLQLTGKPVNLAAIRELNELQGDNVNKAATAFRQILRIGFGVISIFGALGSFIVTLWAGIGLLLGTSGNSPLSNFVPGDITAGWIVYVLSVLSGILLTLLFSILAYALLKGEWSKKTVISIIGIIAAGIITSTSAITTGMLSSWTESNRVMDSIVTTKRKLPEGFSGVKKVNVTAGSVAKSYSDGSDLIIKYIVDDTRSDYKLEAPKGVTPSIVIDGEEARVSVKFPQDVRRYFVPDLTIYGPALDRFIVNGGTSSYESRSSQDLRIDSSAAIVQLYGEFTKVETFGTGDINLSQATVGDVSVNGKPGTYVTLGVVRDLTVVQPDVCPSSTGDWQSRVSVVSVSSGAMTYNGQKSEVKTKNGPCSLLVVGSDSLDYDYYYKED